MGGYLFYVLPGDAGDWVYVVGVYEHSQCQRLLMVHRQCLPKQTTLTFQQVLNRQIINLNKSFYPFITKET